MLLAALLGCPKPPPPEPPFAWEDPPRVPSPSAGTYAAVPARPDDRGLVAVLGEHPWDASLSGAAAAIGLSLAVGDGGLTAPELREAAWRAGWPYPVTHAQVWVGAMGAPPPAQVSQWLLVETGPVGLVRVRGGMKDLWVGLAGPVRVDLGPLPRQLAVGAQLLLPAAPGARATIADPGGELRHGELHSPWSTTVEVEGEWLVEVRDDRGVLAVFPIYVGMIPPELDLLVPTPLPTDDEAALLLAARRLDEVREAYGLRPYAHDPLLLAAARSEGASLSELAARTGTSPGAIWRWSCHGNSVESCLDAIVWDVKARPGLLLPEGLCGLSGTVSPNGVDLRLVVAGP